MTTAQESHVPSEDEITEEAKRGKERLVENTNRWNTSLETLSVQLAYAIIAANWAVNASSNSILANFFAKYSIGTAVLFLAINVVFLGINTEIMWHRTNKADRDRKWWSSQARLKLLDSNTSFPFESVSGHLSTSLRWLRLLLPAVSGLLFALSLRSCSAT